MNLQILTLVKKILQQHALNTIASLSMCLIIQKILTDCERSPTKSAYSKNVLCNTIAFLTMALQETIIKKLSLVIIYTINYIYSLLQIWKMAFLICVNEN